MSTSTARSKAPRRLFTKSMFRKALECPRKLYYQARPEIYHNALNDDTYEHLKTSGEQIGEYCKLLYPKGFQIISGNNNDDDTTTLEEVTKRHLQSSDEKTVTMFEAPVRYQDLFARVDVLQKEHEELRVIEIKSKAWDSSSCTKKRHPIRGKRIPIQSTFLPYIHDVAFQTHVVRNAFPEFHVSSWLLMPDKAKVSKNVGLNSWFPVVNHDTNKNDMVHPRPGVEQVVQSDSHQPVTTLVNVDEFVQHVLDSPLKFPGKMTAEDEQCDGASSFEEDLRLLQQIVENEEEEIQDPIQERPPPPPIGSQCASCEFRPGKDENEASNGIKSGFHECWRQVTGLDDDELERLVVDLWHSNNRDALIQKKKYRLSDLNYKDLKYDPHKDSDHFSRTQRRVYQACGIPETDDWGGFVLHERYLREQMATWRYPLHLIDFETVQPVLPFFPNMAPYEMVAFQFSHHVVLEQDSTSEHHAEHRTQFLHTTPNENPNQAFLEALANALGTDDGTVFMYSPHEHKVLKSLLDNSDESSATCVLRPLLKDNDRAMVDLAKLVERGMFLDDCPGTSLKKMLPSLLTVSSDLKQLYGQPNYGTADVSHNFTNMQWWQKKPDSLTCEDPYELLKRLDDVQEEEGTRTVAVAHGSAAMAAYHVLQWDLLSDTERCALQDSLLRYCELDTLAMAMVVQAWQGWLR